ncbi:MAG: AgmX/PglI C-terminal domain-containing protein [Alphaproteobacteria bacterium]|nr:AgmX/PglI C-terminal domain-containing protein [Alphaproteobacteria bacterium]
MPLLLALWLPLALAEDPPPHCSPEIAPVDGQVSVSVLAVEGALEAPQVKAALEQDTLHYQYCYARVLAEDPTLAGALELRLTVAPDGTVPAAALTEDGLTRPEVGRCAVARLRKARFPVAEAGVTTATVRLEMTPLADPTEPAVRPR